MRLASSAEIEGGRKLLTQVSRPTPPSPPRLSKRVWRRKPVFWRAPPCVQSGGRHVPGHGERERVVAPVPPSPPPPHHPGSRGPSRCDSGIPNVHIERP